MKEQDKSSYQVLRTDQFEEELRKILLYIADNAQSVEPALHVLDDVERAVCSLAEFPGRGALPRDRRLRALNYRFLCVDSYLLFYRCDEKTNIVYVLAIVHTKQQYTNILK